MAVTRFLPSQSAKRTSWKTNGETLDASVMSTRMCLAAARVGPLICRNSSRELPSFSWLVTFGEIEKGGDWTLSNI